MILRRFIAVGLASLALLAAATGLWLYNLNHFQVRGELEVRGLDEPVEVLRDDRGIPYIFAAGTRDAYLAQGFITAQHRLFQLEFYRRLIEGRLSEVVGRRGFASDRWMRLLDPAGNAREHWQRLQPSDRIALQAYADGVNAYIRDYRHEHHAELRLAGIEARPWLPEDLLSIAHYVASTQSQSLRAGLVMHRIRDRIGATRTAMLFPDMIPPDLPDQPPVRDRLAGDGTQDPAEDWLPPGIGAGSNAWAIAPGRSSGAGAVLANDPHLDGRILPGVWHPVGLYTPEARAIGAALPGLPGMLVGRNEHLAFGITNAYGDTQDLYIETPDPEDPGRYLDGPRSLPFHVREEVLRIADDDAPGGMLEERIEVRTTHRGPVISDQPPASRTGRIVSLRWTAAHPVGQGSRLGIDRLWRAGDEGELLRAAGDISLLTLNLVYADTRGTVGKRATGRIPVRPVGHGAFPRQAGEGDDWLGWIPGHWMPARRNPEEGWVGAANHDTRPDYFPFYYSGFFAPGYRHGRIGELLEGPDTLDSREQWQVMLDLYNPQAVSLRPLFVAAMDRLIHNDAAVPGLEEARQALADWDLQDRADSPAPLIYHHLHRTVSRLAFEDVLGPGLGRELLSLTYLWKERLDELLVTGALDRWRGPDLPGSDEILETAVLETLSELREGYGADVKQWAWGDAHRILFTSPLRPEGRGRDFLGGGEHPYDGSGETLQRAAYSWHGGFDVRLHDSLRFLADLSDPERVRASLAGGVVGRQFSRHFRDQLPEWLDGEAGSWWFSEEQVRRNARHRAWLVPAGAE